MKKTTGVSSTTVVTLSRNALTTARDDRCVRTRSASGRPPARRTASTAIHWKDPGLRGDVRNDHHASEEKMTLKSTDANASRWSTTLSRIMSEAPRSAASVR